MKEDYGITNNERHYLRTLTYILDLKTGKMEDVGRFGDSGEGHRSDARGYFDRSAQGFANPNCGGRQPVIFEYLGRTFLLVPSTVLDSLVYNKWTLFDNDVTRLRVAIANGNVPRRIGRITIFEIFEKGNGENRMEEFARIYSQARALFEGDKHPKTNATLLSDLEAWEHNYGVDGIWASGMYCDPVRGTCSFGAANGVERPIYEIQSAYNATRTKNHPSGATSHPERSFYDWKKLTAGPGLSPLDVQLWHNDYVLTEADRAAAIKRDHPGRSDEYFAGSIHTFEILTGKPKWTHHHKVLDTWESVTFQLQSMNKSEIPLKNLYCVAGEGNDSDYAIGPMKAENHDLMIANNKDGTVEALDIDTGAVLWSTRTGWPVSVGSNNYQGAIVGDHYFVATLQWDVYGKDFGNLLHNSSVGPDGEVINRLDVDPIADGIMNASLPVDVCMDKDGGPRRRDIPTHSLVLHRIHIPSGKVTGVLTLFRPSDVEGAYVPFSVAVSAVEDLVVVPGGYSGLLYFVNANTMEIVTTFDHFAYLKNHTNLPDKKSLYVNTNAIFGGDLVIHCAGESFFSGPSEGRYCVALRVPARP